MKVLFRVLVAGAAVALVVVFAGAALAQGNEDEVRELREKIKTLEENQAELYHTLEEKKKPGLAREIAERVTFGGLVEVEGFVDSNKKVGDTSDVTLATVELDFDARLNKRVGAHVLFLWEEDSTDPIEVDEGTITVDFFDGLRFVGGKKYLPFGVFKSHFVSDPQTLELGETNATAAELVFSGERVEASGGVFKGSVSEAGSDDKVDDYYLSLSVSPAEPIVLGGFYMSNLAESGAELTASTVAETVAGWGGFLVFGWQGLKFDAEVISAVGSFDPADLDADSDGRGDRPLAWNIEAAYDVTDRLEVAVKFEGNDDFPDFPETQYGAAASFGLYENVALSAEYLHGEFADDTERDLGTVQIAVEF